MLTNLKYELIDEQNSAGLRRIRALKDFGYVNAGEFGGLVKSKKNLSQEDTCWIYDDAQVCDNARVTGHARVSGNAKIFGAAIVSEYAEVYDNAWVYGNSKVRGHSKVFGNGIVCQCAIVCDHAKVFEYSEVSEYARVSGNSKVYGYAVVTGYSEISGYASVSGISHVFGNACFENIDQISSGNLKVKADAFATAQDSRGYTFLAAWKDKKIVSVTAGCRIWNSIEEARNHFLTDYESNGNVDECIAILSHLNNIFIVKTL